MVRKAAPSVVYVEATRPFHAGYRFGRPVTQLRKVTGSGVVVEKSGYIVTNSHVVGEDARRITVQFDPDLDAQVYEARLVSSDPSEDLALLKVDGNRDFPPVQRGTSSDLMIGERVVAIGNPFGQKMSVSRASSPACTATWPSPGPALQRPDPDRRRDQQGQQRRSPAQHPGRADRHHHRGEPRRREHGLRHPHRPRGGGARATTLLAPSASKLLAGLRRGREQRLHGLRHATSSRERTGGAGRASRRATACCRGPGASRSRLGRRLPPDPVLRPAPAPAESSCGWPPGRRSASCQVVLRGWDKHRRHPLFQRLGMTVEAFVHRATTAAWCGWTGWPRAARPRALGLQPRRRDRRGPRRACRARPGRSTDPDALASLCVADWAPRWTQLAVDILRDEDSGREARAQERVLPGGAGPHAERVPEAALAARDPVAAPPDPVLYFRTPR